MLNTKLCVPAPRPVPEAVRIVVSPSVLDVYTQRWTTRLGVVIVSVESGVDAAVNVVDGNNAATAWQQRDVRAVQEKLEGVIELAANEFVVLLRCKNVREEYAPSRGGEIEGELAEGPGTAA